MAEDELPNRGGGGGPGDRGAPATFRQFLGDQRPSPGIMRESAFKSKSSAS
eukprot:CAMPEP_0180828478 /NCGR_PEP_ID=MMETSP1038_2-20121128/74701_1 /TAXON_ID=632150 /ORGANISM="Azadinium spinosum, Strain 3D9" /LENGTH=50 /DNA_ID=CAMNT_0022871361 /DNA_START=225 /DNA_END=377 /DNA_ORIENTATION=-